ncbi:MAG: class I SAM-dependent methyltransferase [Hamadaea sp.]|nr:class I SAM-dependent methyltransferase [Hamadaea sp.]
MTSPALSFGAAAGLYDAIRPTYPAPALAWALGERPLTVVDLGAGTGLLTRVLLDAGHTVISVEPDAQMLAVCAERNPATDARSGSAEQIPLPDHGADAVVCGQAYHWFTPERALPEIRRVLRPGGVFAPVWNIRDEEVDWVAAYSQIVGSEGKGTHERWIYGDVAPWFTEPERAVFRHEVAMAPQRLVDLARSRSYYLTADDPEKARLETELAGLAATHPALAGRDTVDLPYLTCVFRMRPIDL